MDDQPRRPSPLELTMLDRIGAFLQGAAPNACCPGCLADSFVMAPNDVIQRIVRLVREGEAVAKRGQCTLCGGCATSSPPLLFRAAA